MKTYKITYHMHPDEDVVITVQANSEDDAIVFAKQYRTRDSFSVEEVEG